MLQFMNNLPSDVVGIHAIGEVTKEDVETVLMPQLNELLKRQHEISYIFVLETHADNLRMAAWWQDLKNALKQFTKWIKMAIVSDQNVEYFTDPFRFYIPGKSKGFPMEQLPEAVHWIRN